MAKRRRVPLRNRLRRWGPGLLLLSPSIALLAVFVNGLIAWTIRLSLTDRHTAIASSNFVGVKNYVDLFANDINDRFVHSLKNLLVFTVVFLVGALLLGLLWALLLERGARAEGLFRTVYLFPMAVSFVASGVVALADELGYRRPGRRDQPSSRDCT